MIKTSPKPNTNYSFEAELAAREAEINRREAALKRAELHAIPVQRAEVRLAETPVVDDHVDEEHRADEFVDARLAEIAEREENLANRERLITMLEANLEQSRQRLEERLKEFEKLKAAQSPSGARAQRFRVQSVEARYFSPGSYTKEGDWWTTQLGKRPHVTAA